MRLRSLDALRGFDMFWIVGGDALVHALAALTGWRVLNQAATQMSHVAWDGFRLYDLIFPLFIFVAGVAMPYSLARRVEDGDDRRRLVGHVVRRAAILVALGVLYNNGFDRGFDSEFDLAEWRYPSVLGRIGLAYLGGALLVLYAGLRGQIIWFVGLLLGYWAALTLIPVPGAGAGVLTAEGSLVGYIDRALIPGRLLLEVHDPEGLLSTVPAVATALSGALAGRFLRTTDRPGTERVAILAGAGVVALAAGALWGLVFPVNKNLWTSSFVLITTGCSLLLLALFHLLVDVRDGERPAFPLIVIGANSILIYLAARFLPFGGIVDLALDPLLGRIDGALIHVWWWIGIIVLEWLLLWFLYRRRIFLKI